MKRVLFITLCCVSLFSCRQEVILDKEHFPDEAFRNVIGYFFSLSEGDVIPEETLAGVVDMDLSRLGISDLKGIEFFPNLIDLYCSDNLLTEIDLSKNVALESAELYGNALTALDLTHNPLLKRLGCSFNRLTSLDMSHNPELTMLLCNENPLESIDVSKNPKLSVLGVNHCRLKDLNVSQNPSLTTLYCSRNKLKEIDLSNNPEIENLVYEEPAFGILRIIRPEGKPDLGKGDTRSWSDWIGRFELSDSDMDVKYRLLVKDKGERKWFRKVPYDSLEFERLMELMDEDLEFIKSLHVRTAADTLKLEDMIKTREASEDIVYSPGLRDSLQVPQRVRLEQNRTDYMEELVRLSSELERAGVKGMDEIRDGLNEANAYQHLRLWSATHLE